MVIPTQTHLLEHGQFMMTTNKTIYKSQDINQYNVYTSSNSTDEVIVKNLSHGAISNLKTWVFKNEDSGLNIDDYIKCRESAKYDQRLANLLDELKTIYLLLKNE